MEVFVSHGWITPAVNQGEERPAAAADLDTFILVPFTYAADEPVDEVLEAASMTANISWVLTGRPPAAVVQRAPSNVVFTGFVSDSEFKALQVEARAILALTKQASTMQSAGYEAVASATPLITVSEAVIQEYFGENAIYTDLTPGDLATSALRVVEEHAVWQPRMAALRDAVMTSQPRVAEEIRQWVARTAQQEGQVRR
ncbi:hypothetical protein PUW79_14315 [Microbacterium sp. NE2HP2]|uniref:hypothetical protein n=1 Tax=Microbacterium plantarum TaxID=1816425 RepID=UPI0023664D87|nr:hypothetical protein [Microbacterium plantarum]MDD7945814.1 hypothetical protein [Microbacterium plantarum]